VDVEVDAAAVERAREAALRLLDRTRKTRRELERRLAERGFDAPVAGAALDRLARVGLVDDVEYARAFLRARLARRAVGLRVLENQLQARGVSAADRSQALADLAELADRAGADGDPEGAVFGAGGAGERARAERALGPLLRRWRGLEPREARARATAALLRRGFEWATVRDVLASLPVADPHSTGGDP
jgi:SOS response regulatory protein OraA/RecX